MKKATILVVDDSTTNRKYVCKILERFNIDVVQAADGQEALDKVAENEVALILLDVQMPKMDGFEVANRLKEDEATKYIPIIFITALSDDEKYSRQGYESGAVDYLFKPVDEYTLESKVRVFLDLHTQKELVKHSEGELKRSNELQNLILESSKEAILVIDPNGKTVVANRLARKFFDGVEVGKDTREAFSSMSFSGDDLLDLDTESLPIFRALRGEHVQNMQVYKVQDQHDEFKTFMVTAHPLEEDVEVVGAVMVASDITEKKRLERDLEDERAKVIANEKLVALGEMAGGIAHEINNPLAIIRTSAEMICRLVAKDKINVEKLNKSAKVIEGTTDRIVSVINGLLRFARVDDENAFEEVCVNELVKETLLFFQASARKKKVLLESDVNIERFLECRPVPLSQVLYNLLENAIHAVQEDEEKWVCIEVTENEDLERVSFRVINSGAKITKDVIDRMFHPFFTTKEIGQGTGLGLSIARGTIEEHNGRIYVDESHTHTCVVVEIPLSRGVPLHRFVKKAS